MEFILSLTNFKDSNTLIFVVTFISNNVNIHYFIFSFRLLCRWITKMTRIYRTLDKLKKNKKTWDVANHQGDFPPILNT